MKRVIALVLAAGMLLLCACGAAANPQEPSPAPEPAESFAPDADWYGAYARFVDENHAALSQACQGIQGISFADLDRDAVPELLVYGAGASASMSLSIFDLAADDVVCISCCFDPQLLSGMTVRAGAQTGKLYLNANGADNFRLLENPSDGTQFYLLESGNGALTFRWQELIGFGCGSEGLATMELLMSRLDYFDDETGALTESFCSVGDQVVLPETYQAAYKAYFAGLRETGFAVPDVFLWNGDYAQTREGCMQMLADAADAYRFATG